MDKATIETEEKETLALTCKTGPQLSLGEPGNQSLPTRVLFLTDSFSPHAGGSREYYYNILRELVDLGGTEVVILTKKVPGWGLFDQKHSSISFRIQRRFKPLKSYKYGELHKGVLPFFQALWRTWRDSPEIIHAGDLYPQGLIAWLINRLTGIPYVVYAHGEEIMQTDRFRYQPRVRDRIYKGAATVVANSEFTKKQLLRIGVSKDRIVKITPGVDAARFRPERPNEQLKCLYNLNGKTVILTVARLVPRKGHKAALQAFARVCREFPEAHYLIAGTGPEEQKLRQLIEQLGMQGRVTFTGYVASETLPNLYNLCDIMLLANREEADGDVEGFGIVFLEANAAGKPVIGGRSGGAIEAVADGVTGRLVDPDSSVELEAILREFLSNPKLRQNMGAAGRRRVESEFNWKQRAQSLHEVNCKILYGPLQASPSQQLPRTRLAPRRRPEQGSS